MSRKGEKRNQSQKEERHNKFASYWAFTLAALCSTGLATVWIDLGPFWKGYVLDMTGPAWNYILIRGLFTNYRENAWREFFTPGKTFAVIISLCLAIEFAQFLELYESTFDPFDLLAYISILFPVFLLDLKQSK